MTDISPAASHRRWTQGDVTLLRSAVAGGETLDRIADLLMRSPEEVATMMDRLRLRL